MTNLGIRQRVLFLTIIPTIVISLFMGIYFISVRVKELNQNVISNGTAIVSQLASLGQNGVFTSDFDTLRSISRKKITKEISSVVFYNRNGSEIASAGKLSSAIPQENLQENNKIQIKEYPNSIAFIAPVSLPDIILEDKPTQDWMEYSDSSSSIIGWVKVEVELYFTNAKIYKTLVHVGSIVLLGLAICWLIAYRMGNDVTLPIVALTNAVLKIKQGRLYTRVKSQAKWELGELKSGINTMAGSLENAHQEMQNKIDQATLDLRRTLETIEFQNLELEIARKNAESLSNAKSEFLATMSHELKTPLNGMLGFINLLGKTKLNKEQHNFVDIVKKSSDNLLSIINEILDFSKIEAGKLQMSYEPMDLIECIEDSITLLAPLANDKALDLIPFIYTDVPQKIIGDNLRIKQVITNLVSNAIKFTESGNVIIRVMVEEEFHNKITLCVSITDTGIGLTEEQKKSLFKAFNQASPNIQRKFGGTGLGLVICKRLVEQMQGEIDVESSPKKGSTFWFTFKAKKIESAPVINSNSLVDDKSILVLEENDIARLSILHTLKLWNINATAADRIENCYKIDNINDYSTIIVSIPHDKKNIKLYKEILTKTNKLGINNIVLYTGSEQSIKDTLELNFINNFVVKPIKRKELYNAICELFAIQAESNDIESEEILPEIEESFVKDDINVLAVDDNEANLKLIEAMLKSHKYKITKAINGESAIKFANESKFDIILMDINMPGMDGTTTSKIIKKSSLKNRKTPIVALSAYVANKTLSQLQAAGIYNYLTKPINESDLKLMIKISIDPKNNKDNLPLDPVNTNANNTKIEKSIDLGLAVKLAAGNKELALELLSMLIKSLPEARANINKYFIDKSFQELKDEVHKLHGACCYCGVPKLKQNLKTIEQNLNDCLYTNLEYLIEVFNKEIDAIMSQKNNIKDYFTKKEEEILEA